MTNIHIWRISDINLVGNRHMQQFNENKVQGGDSGLINKSKINNTANYKFLKFYENLSLCINVFL